MTREQELEKAIDRAVLPPRDYRIYRALFKRADWKTGMIPARWQPRSLRDIARDAHLDKATVCRGLNHLESHGWVARRRVVPGRGHATVYELMAGMDCDCFKERPEPVTDAERMRWYRRRKKESTTKEASQIDVTQPNEASQIDVTKRRSERNEVAGQGPFPAKRDATRGKGKRDMKSWPDPDREWMTAHTFPESMGSWPEGTIGAAMNRSTDTSYARAA